MPMTTTHALVPLAATVALAQRPVPWKLVLVAASAAAAPDLDGITKHLLHLAGTSIYAHRGAAHSLFVAIAFAVLAALFHRRFGVQRSTAGLVVGASMASHGMLDMMTSSGLPVAYLWPLSSARLFADWRPIQTSPVHMSGFVAETLFRLNLELWQLIVPMFAMALAVRLVRNALRTGGNRLIGRIVQGSSDRA